MAEVNIMMITIEVGWLEGHHDRSSKPRPTNILGVFTTNENMMMMISKMRKIVILIVGRADHFIQLCPDMDNRPDRRNDELCSLKSPCLHLRWPHHKQEARRRSSNSTAMFYGLILPHHRHHCHRHHDRCSELPSSGIMLHSIARSGSILQREEAQDQRMQRSFQGLVGQSSSFH